jgi:uncharacterized membrane protein YjfL (UPF0719 family)
MTTALLAFIDVSSVPALILLAECFGLLFIGKIVFDISTPQFKVIRQLGEQKNVALGVTMAMYYLAVAIVVTGVASDTSDVALPVNDATLAVTTTPTTTAPAITGPSIDWPELRGALLDVGIWGVIGILLLGVSRVANDRLILHQFATTKEIIEDKNVGTGVVEGAAYIASAFIIRASISGEGGGGLGAGIGLTVLFFALSQVMLAVFTIAYSRVTKYDLHAEIERDNVAVGVAMAGSLIALGVVLGAGQHLAEADTVARQVLSFCILSIVAIVVLIVTKYLGDWMILTGIDLDKELSANQNVAVACVAAMIPVALAALVAATWAG